jgi:hypothetical protein
VQNKILEQTQKIDMGARMARDEMMVALIQLAQEEIKGERSFRAKGESQQQSKMFPVERYTLWYTSQTEGARKIKRKDRVYEQAWRGFPEPPMNRTGTLRRSIRGEKFRVGFASYIALVGPTVIYGRRVELGGGEKRPWPDGVKFPYMEPAFRKYVSSGIHQQIINKHLGSGGMS